MRSNRSEIVQAVAATGSIADRIREVSRMTSAIAAAVEEQEAATRDIVHGASHAAEGARRVTGTIDAVAGTAGETGAAADQVLAAASSPVAPVRGPAPGRIPLPGARTGGVTAEHRHRTVKEA